jgi:FAD/FMN-containing dehydrogenase
VTHGFERPSPFTQPVLMPWGGAVGRVGEDATPMTKRNASWVVHPFAMWEDPADSDKNIAWTKAVRRAMQPYANGGIYLNYIGHEGPDRVQAAYGEEKYRRLATIKAEWDPTNRFKGNQNIQPA